jgi:uncharacterized protein
MSHAPRPTHFEIQAENLERARHFYSSVFGWKIAKWDGPIEYWAVVTGEASEPGINGGLVPRQSHLEDDTSPVHAFVCTLEVDDLETYAKRIEWNGGGLAIAPKTLPQVGTLAYYHDTEGNVFGLLEPTHA